MPTILAIDDSLTIRKLVDIVLKGAGYTVLLAEKGAAGLELAKEHKPDLIVLDYVLPDLPSPEICRQLLEHPDTASIPVLLISTNGAAIRQLYSDSRNVRDYLTKPFQSKVLQSVIAHLLAQKTPPANELEALPVPPAPPADEPVTTDARSPETATLTAPASAPAPAPRMVAGRAAAASNDAQTILRGLLNTRFRTLARMIPELEARRGKQPAETYYLPFLLRNELLADISAEMGRSQIAAERGDVLIAGTADWMAIDTTLLHLGRTAATGVFSLKLPGENIDVLLKAGEIVSITSDNPKIYCSGASLNFRSLPASAISTAVSAQQKMRVPFFISLYRAGALKDPTVILMHLRQQGARALHRALTTPGVRYAFVPKGGIPDPGSFSLGLSPRQAVLESIRLVDDWLEIESVTGSVETVFRQSAEAAEILAELQLTQEERQVLDFTDGVRALHDVSAAAGLGLYETCAAVYRFLKLQVLAVETSAAPITDSSVEEFLNETSGDTWAANADHTPFPLTTDTPHRKTPWPKF